MATAKLSYPAAPVTITIAPENVASTSFAAGTAVAGVESAVISNVSDLDIDHLISGIWTAGSTPSAGTQVQVWVIPTRTDNLAGTRTYHDVMDGTASAESVTTQGMLQNIGRLGAVITIDIATANQPWGCAAFSVAALFNGVLPPSYSLFLAHNTGANSNSTAGNHIWSYQRVQVTSA